MSKIKDALVKNLAEITVAAAIAPNWKYVAAKKLLQLTLKLIFKVK